MVLTRLRTSGIWAAIVFWIALFAFGAWYPGYSHATRAISELGAFGAPHALAWNLVGFIAPGLLLAACGTGIALAVDGTSRILPSLLVLSGLGFAGTGAIPAEMANGTPVMDSRWTAGHLIMTVVSALPWVIGAWVLAVRVVRRDGWSDPALVAGVMAMVATCGLSLNVFSGAIPYFAVAPGLAQRTAFAAYFAWFGIVSWVFLAPNVIAHRVAAGTASPP